MSRRLKPYRGGPKKPRRIKLVPMRSMKVVVQNDRGHCSDALPIRGHYSDVLPIYVLKAQLLLSNGPVWPSTGAIGGQEGIPTFQSPTLFCFAA